MNLRKLAKIFKVSTIVLASFQLLFVIITLGNNSGSYYYTSGLDNLMNSLTWSFVILCIFCDTIIITFAYILENMQDRKELLQSIDNKLKIETKESNEL